MDKSLRYERREWEFDSLKRCHKFGSTLNGKAPGCEVVAQW